MAKRDLCRRTGTRHYGGYWIDVASPYAEQQHFRAGRILEHVVRVRKPFYLIKARPARVWPRRRTHSKSWRNSAICSCEWFRRSSTRGGCFGTDIVIMFLRHIQLSFSSLVKT